MEEKTETAGVSGGTYAREEEYDKSKSERQARLTETLKTMHQQHHKSLTPHSKIRDSFYSKKG